MEVPFKDSPPVRAHRIILLRNSFFANAFDAEGNGNLNEELSKLNRDAVDSLTTSVTLT